MTVYIIILHYRNIKDTLLCLQSIAGLNCDRLSIKVILIVNNSIIKIQKSKLYRKIQSLQIIQNTKNLGFAGGMNVGIREALNDKRTDYILILNNDTIVPADLLTKLLEQPSDITAPVIKFRWEGKWVYDYGGKVNWWTGRTLHIESTNKQIIQLSNQPIDYVSGCCMMIKRRVFEKIGLFDENYFFYFEDADFCTRAKRAGFDITVNPKVTVFHKLGGAVGRWSNRAIFYNLRSNFIFITKNLGLKRPIGYTYLLVLTGKIIFNRIFHK